jgi:hypothetical protein
MHVWIVLLFPRIRALCDFFLLACDTFPPWRSPNRKGHSTDLFLDPQPLAASGLPAGRFTPSPRSTDKTLTLWPGLNYLRRELVPNALSASISAT